MPFCLSAEHPATGQPIQRVTIARGNVTPIDHGRTVVRELATALAPLGTLPLIEPGTGRWPIDIQPIGDGPLTFQTMPEDPRYGPDGRLATGRHDLDAPANAAMPAMTIEYDWDGTEPELFRPVRSLIGSDPFDAHFVAEIGNGGATRLRFGDDQYGRRVGLPIAARARYRIGNGRSGNIGAGALFHVVEPDAADLIDPANPGGAALPFPALAGIRQPLPARGGIEPETIEEARQLAPEAFRAETFRAVTERDYEAAAMKLGGVAAAKARFVWTGSWHTVFVALHPSDTAQLDRMPGGGALLRPAFAVSARAWLNRYRLAGYDFAVRAANYVPIELDIRLCVARNHFQGEVLEAVTEALSNRRLAGARTGFFHPTNFSFGSAVYSSRIYALLQGIDGVESATIQVMKRFWDLPNGELERGVVPMAPDEIARLDNDRNQPEFGVLRLSAVGGL
jgi:predicted phage baseplate assembly protein